MTEFGSELRRRIEQTVEDLAAARAAGDDYLVDVRLGELESLARLAAEHGITVDGVEESLSRHGLPTPAAGVPLVLDLPDRRPDRAVTTVTAVTAVTAVPQGAPGGMAAG